MYIQKNSNKHDGSSVYIIYVIHIYTKQLWWWFEHHTYVELI